MTTPDDRVLKIARELAKAYPITLSTGREESHPMDLTALELGWRIGPSGEQIPPEGWPDASHATKCVVMEAAA